MKPLKLILVTAFIGGLIFSGVPDIHADVSGELILKILVKKGIITQKEADEILAESKSIEKETPTSADVAAHVKKASWIEKIKLKGDVRLRTEYRRPGAGTYVNRQRIRARIAAEADLTDTVKAGIGLGSGGSGIGTARSTNQTLFQAFSTKPMDLDLAYVDWRPSEILRVTGGKYPNPLYYPCDLLWDTDIRFEGVSTNIKYNLEQNLNIPMDLMMNAGIFPLDDLAIDKKNPYLYAVQGGLGSSVDDIMDWKAFVGYLDFANIKNTTSGALVPTSCTANDNGRYYYDFNVLEVSGDTTLHFFENEFSEPFDKPLIIFGDYVQNLAADNGKNHGWEAGVKFGKRPDAFGDWRVIYNFRWLERDSFPDDFPDADAFRGRTDGYGHEAIFSYGLAKNIWLEFDYYVFRDKTRGTDPNDKWGQIIQADLNAKF